MIVFPSIFIGLCDELQNRIWNEAKVYPWETSQVSQLNQPNPVSHTLLDQYKPPAQGSGENMWVEDIYVSSLYYTWFYKWAPYESLCKIVNIYLPVSSLNCYVI